MIYLDYSATSWPKSETVLKAMSDFLRFDAGNPGRSGHALSMRAGMAILEVREQLADFFGLKNPMRMIFTQNATTAINTAIKGILNPGDRVIVSGMEHNSVMRPLISFGSSIDLQIANCSRDGKLDLDDLEKKLKTKTRLVVINHASNVCGTIQNISEISKIVHEHGALLLVDSAQTAGVIDINVQEMGIDLLAFTGHKSFHGPPGTGGLVIHDDFDITQMRPLVHGGTGSLSKETAQPNSLPDKYQAGTQNSVGIVGLGQALKELKQTGLENIRSHEQKLTSLLRNGLNEIDGIKLYGTSVSAGSTSTVSFTLNDKDVSTVGQKLDEEFGILCRVGLHCAPVAHKTLGTFPEGTVRLAPGKNTTEEEIHQTIQAVKRVVTT